MAANAPVIVYVPGKQPSGYEAGGTAALGSRKAPAKPKAKAKRKQRTIAHGGR
jgi:hypothetical protein